MAIKADLIGRKYGRLQVSKRIGALDGKPSIHWECVCECGNTTIVKTGNLQNGSTNSCGCFRAERTAAMSIKHGGYASRTYITWKSILQRCRDPGFRAYKDWGGRGICVCDRWLEFANFLADMGKRPAGKSIDRIDNNGNYEPGNCRWATPKEQANNRRPPTKRPNKLIRKVTT